MTIRIGSSACITSRARTTTTCPNRRSALFRDNSTTLDLAPVYTYNAEGADLTDRAQPERVSVLPVGSDYFRVLGVRLLAGQPFERDAERANAGVVVISERIWREYLGARPDAVGQTLSINGVRQQVVAVVPDAFEDPLVPGVEIWTPLDFQSPNRTQWYNHYLSVIGRLRPGATLEQAQAELKTIALQIEPNYGRSETRRWARVTPLQVDTVGTAGSLLWILLGAVALLLTIACVNVAGLVLARGAAREQELAVRAALGCSRWRLARQLIVESLLLSLAGGIVGLASAQAVTRLLLAAAPESVARVAAGSSGSAVVFAFGFIVALVAGLAFGLAPALQHARPNLEGVLRESGRGTSGGRRQARFRQVLVVSQIALALVLLTGAGLLLRSFERLADVNLGLRAENVLTFQVNLPAGRYSEPERRAAFHVAFQDRLAAIPGVKAAGAVSRLPVTGTYHTWTNGRTDRPENANVGADQRVVEGRFFEALGIRVLRGRTFSAQDGATPRQVVINDRLARTLFPAKTRSAAASASPAARPRSSASLPMSRSRRARRRRRSSITCTASSRPIATGRSPKSCHPTCQRGDSSTTSVASSTPSIPRSCSISPGCSPTSSAAASSRNGSHCSSLLPTRSWR